MNVFQLSFFSASSVRKHLFFSSLDHENWRYHSNDACWHWRAKFDFFFFVSLSAVDYRAVGSGCEVDVRSDLGNPQPLYIRPNSTQIFHPTDRSGTLKLEKSQKIELFCTNGFVSPRGIVDRSLVTLECAYENLFIMNDRTYRFNEFSCRKNPYFSVRQRPRRQLGRDDGRCFNNSTLLDVGFAVNERRFIVVFTACFNPISEQTYYAKYRLTPANVAAQQGFNRPKFIQGDYFPGKDINDLYSRVSQRQLLTDVLRSEELAEQLVEETGNIFMSRGRQMAILFNFNYFHPPTGARRRDITWKVDKTHFFRSFAVIWIHHQFAFEITSSEKSASKMARMVFSSFKCALGLYSH